MKAVGPRWHLQQQYTLEQLFRQIQKAFSKLAIYGTTLKQLN